MYKIYKVVVYIYRDSSLSSATYICTSAYFTVYEFDTPTLCFHQCFSVTLSACRLQLKLKHYWIFSAVFSAFVYILDFSYKLIRFKLRINILSPALITAHLKESNLSHNIRINLYARSNMLFDILRLPSSRRAALGPRHYHTMTSMGCEPAPYALLHRSSPHYALCHRRRHGQYVKFIEHECQCIFMFGSSTT